jgi:hypothetical protein
MDLLISSAVLFLLAHFLSSPSVPPVDGASGAITANWSADLRAAVGSAPVGLVVGRGHETALQPKTSLWFVDNNTVVATFVTREENGSLSSHDSANVSLPLRLRAIFLDASTGKVMSIHAWPSQSRFAGIVAANDGNFITQRGVILTLYSPDAKEVRSLSLPPVPQDLWGWVAHPSPTGRNILFATPNLTTTDRTSWIWVNASPLEVIRSWSEVQSGWVGISDDSISMIACSFPLFRCDPSVEVKGLATDWKTIAPIERRPQLSPRFLNKDMIFLAGHPWQLLETNGKVLLTETTPFEGSTAISSSNGQRFVIPFFQSKGGVAALDVGAHGELKRISVYDAPFHERAYSLDIKGAKIKEMAQLSLSPDGSKLAILYDESVYLFQLGGTIR